MRIAKGYKIVLKFNILIIINWRWMIFIID